MDIHSTRRERLRSLADEEGGQAALAEAIGRQRDYVNRILNGRINLGEKLAREIERLTGKPLFWLDGNMDEARKEAEEFDRAPPAEKASRRVDQLKVVEATGTEIKKRGFLAIVKAIDEYLSEKGIDWGSERRAECYWHAYKAWVESSGDLKTATRQGRGFVNSDVAREKRAAKRSENKRASKE
jgi:plasmid maintenance system antidote protein VapI